MPARRITWRSRSTPNSCSPPCGCGCTGESGISTSKAEEREPRGRRRTGQYSAGRRPAREAARLRGDPRRTRGEPYQGRVGERGTRTPSQKRGRGRPDRRLHARTRWVRAGGDDPRAPEVSEDRRSEEHTSELQSPYVISYAVSCL